MLVKDSEKVRKRKRQDAQKQQRWETGQVALQEARGASLIQNADTSVANVDRQAGRILSPKKFEEMVQRINRDIIVEPHPGVFAPKDSRFHQLNFDKACVYLKMLDGAKVFLIVCEGDWMPEWTAMTTRNDMVRVPDDPNKPEGFWKKVEIPWNRKKRGWREVLLYLIQKKLVTLEAVEKVFGAGDRPSWKILTGKGSGILAA